MKHQRLNILNKPCKFPDLDPSQWLTAPGFHNSTNRIKAAENDLNRKYNLGKHSLVWNHKLGKIKNKPDYGLIWCALCGRTWPWDKRMCNLSKTKCHPSETPPAPPDWVITLGHFDPSDHLQNAAPKMRVRRRLTGKQPDPVRNSEIHDRAATGQSASSSSMLPRQGIG